jgi:hypothetical protein
MPEPREYPDAFDEVEPAPARAEKPGDNAKRSRKPNGNGSAAGASKLILTLPEFLAGYVAPDYLIDGLLQRHYFYALTGMTGAGKTAVALLIAVHVSTRAGGQRLGSHDIEPGRVIYIACENATDVQARLIGMGARMGFEPGDLDLFVIEQFETTLEKALPRITKETEAIGPVSLVVVDTSAAIFPGDDENNNPQMIAHAKMQRRLCDLPGRPCVLALCHPPKNVSGQEQLLPRGGGGYLNETDGNLTLFTHGDRLSDLHWTGKLRGPDFEKVTFRMSTVTTTRVVDAKGRLLPTVMASIVTDAEAEENEAKAAFQENKLLAAMLAEPNGSFAAWAKHCGWMTQALPGEEAQPYKSLVHRVMKRLTENRFVTKNGRAHALTKAGIEATKGGA